MKSKNEIIVPPEAYAEEYHYQGVQVAMSSAFNELLARYPQDDSKIIETLNIANAKAAGTKYILSPEFLENLQKTDPELYAKIFPTYYDFLGKNAGV